MNVLKEKRFNSLAMLESSQYVDLLSTFSFSIIVVADPQTSVDTALLISMPRSKFDDRRFIVTAKTRWERDKDLIEP